MDCAPKLKGMYLLDRIVKKLGGLLTTNFNHSKVVSKNLIFSRNGCGTRYPSDYVGGGGVRYSHNTSVA